MTSPALVDSVLHAIGRTPLVRLRRIVPPDSASIVVKLEYFNPTGSYKDRMALAMIEGAEARGALRPGMRVVEFTGGSTGSSLAMVCAMKGYEFHPLSSDAFASEKLDTMRAFGADLELVPSDGGKVTPALFDRFRARIAELTKDPDTFWTDQFNNRDALDGYARIGHELVEQIGTWMGSSAPWARPACSSACHARSKSREVRRASSPSSRRHRRSSPPARGDRIASKERRRDLAAAPGTGAYDEVRAIDERKARAMAAVSRRRKASLPDVERPQLVGALETGARARAGKSPLRLWPCDTGLKYLAGDLYK